MSTSSMKIAIYCRRSTVDSDEQRSIDEQEAECRRFAAALGEVVRVYRELGSGVTGGDRPVFVEMIKDAERRAFETIVTLDVSRFGRFDVNERGYWLHRLRVVGVTVRYVYDDAKLGGEAGPIMGAVLQASAHDQSRKIGLRVVIGQTAAATRGTWPGGPIPYGYSGVHSEEWKGTGRRNTRLVIEESEAAVVRRVFADYRSGFGTTAIAGRLNAESVRSPKGRSWEKGTVRAVLVNPIYKGDIVRGAPRRGRGAVQRGKFFHGSPSGPVSAGVVAEPIVVRDVAPAIVTREVFDRVQELMEKRAGARTGGVPGLLTGIGRCAECGGPLGITRGGGSRGRGTPARRYYRCTRSRLRGGSATWGRCGGVKLRADRLEPTILDLVRSVTAVEPEALRQRLAKLLPSVAKVNIAELEKRRRQLAARRDAILMDPEASQEFVQAGLARLTQEDARLRCEIEAAQAATSRGDDLQSIVAGATEAARRLMEPNTENGHAALRAALAKFTAKLTIGSAPSRTPKPVEFEVYTPEGAALSEYSDGARSSDKRPNLRRG